MSRLWRRLASFFHRERLDRELDEEMRFHLEMKTEQLGDAYRARRAFGNPVWLKEVSREMWGWGSMERLARDVRHALRLLRRSPGFTLVAVLTLALGLGANTAIFTLLYNVVLRPLPYPEPDRLMKVDLIVTSDQRGARRISYSYPKFEELRRLNNVFESLAAYALRDFNFTGTGDPERLSGEYVSATYFPMLGVRAATGRTFLPEEDQTPGARPVAVISDGLWRRRFGADPAAVGRTIRLNDIPLTIVGVAPEGFRGDSGRAEVWAPMMMAPAVLHGRSMLTSRMTHWHQVVGRLKPGVTPAQASLEVQMIMRRLEELHPSTGRHLWDAGAMPLGDSKIDLRVRKALIILYVAVGFVLLIACVNLANLLLGRAVARQKEVALRLALGASRVSLVRQFLTESLLLALLGGLAGLVLAVWSMDLLAFLRPEGDTGFWPRYLREIDRDALKATGPVIAFNVLLSLVTGMLFGLAPALRASRLDVNETLKRGAMAWSQGLGRLRRVSSRSALIAAQMAAVLVLLAAAGLMIRSFSRLLTARIGIQPQRILTFRVTLPSQKYSTAAARDFVERAMGRVSALPGVESVTLASGLPVRGQWSMTHATIDGEPDTHLVAQHVVGPEYFKLFRIPLVKGRFLTEQDLQGSPRFAVVNETAARQWFGEEDPIGHRISWGETFEIAGVVGDVKYESVEAPVGPDVYYCGFGNYVAVRTAGDPMSLAPVMRKVVSELEPEAPVYEVRTMEEHVAAATSHARFSTVLLAAFAALALVLAAVGVYGVFSYSVAARTRELGIRMALGAHRNDVLWLVVSDGALLCLAGLALGLPAAFAATRVLASLLYEVTPADPATFAVVSLVLVVAGLLACYIPARRASKVDPMVALRYE